MDSNLTILFSLIRLIGVCVTVFLTSFMVINISINIFSAIKHTTFGKLAKHVMDIKSVWS